MIMDGKLIRRLCLILVLVSSVVIFSGLPASVRGASSNSTVAPLVCTPQKSEANNNASGYYAGVSASGCFSLGVSNGGAWGLTMSCVSGSSNCPTSSGVGLAAAAVFAYYYGGTEHCIISCKGFATQDPYGWNAYSLVVQFSGFANKIVTEGQTGYITSNGNIYLANNYVSTYVN